jgi:hypothetical protein
MQEYRAYFFTLFHLRTMQQGIQASHCVSTMALALEQKVFKHQEQAYRVYYEWAESPTKILLNGGSSDYMELYKKLIRRFGDSLKLPYAWFNEPDIYNIMTSIGIVVPDYIYGIKVVDVPPEMFSLSLEDILNTSSADDTEEMYLLYLTLRSASLAT